MVNRSLNKAGYFLGFPRGIGVTLDSHDGSTWRRGLVIRFKRCWLFFLEELESGFGKR